MNEQEIVLWEIILTEYEMTELLFLLRAGAAVTSTTPGVKNLATIISDQVVNQNE